MPEVVIQVRGVHKHFPGVHALKGVDLELRQGEVHGLIGENGAGKSTLVKILIGAYQPDAGALAVGDRQVAGGSPRAARDHGIVAIHQEPRVAPALSAVANVFLARPLKRGGVFLAERAMRHRFQQLAEELGTALSPDARAGDLSVGQQQTIEIMRALQQEARVILMDEPTASLPPQERTTLFEAISRLRARGAAVVYISHNLEEVLRNCDVISVMRDGEKVASLVACEASSKRLVEAMLGDKLDAALRSETSQQESRRRARPTTETLLDVLGLTVPGILEGVSFSVRRGEILGIAGLVGSGRSTILRSLAGAEPQAEGRMVIDGREVAWPTRPGAARKVGIALAPEDRRRQGLVLTLSGAENIVLPWLRQHAVAGALRGPLVGRTAKKSAEEVGFDPRRLKAPAGTLSGGNQQKLVLSKWLVEPPQVLLVDEPVRGIDVGAKAEIFELLTRFADRGMGIVMASEEIEEMVSIAHRVVTLAGGRITGEVEGSATEIAKVLEGMFAHPGGTADAG